MRGYRGGNDPVHRAFQEVVANGTVIQGVPERAHDGDEQPFNEESVQCLRDLDSRQSQIALRSRGVTAAVGGEISPRAVSPVIVGNAKATG